MRRSPAELALKERFEAFYARSREPVMLSVERRVCGCDYGGNSWTTRSEADEVGAHLGLGPGTRLLELGAGAGWPGLYFARQSGCSVVLVDLPEVGLQLAFDRAVEDGVAGRVGVVVADAADLPFAERAFDAISHSDLLCCLDRKAAVLAGCRRVIRRQGRMAFTVISIAPGVGHDQRRRALANGPDFVDADMTYPEMLDATGWQILCRRDLTDDYAESCRRQIEADEDHADALEALLGADEFAERLRGWYSKLEAIRDGLFLRQLFVAAPAG